MTGAAGGIGSACARALAADGLAVCLVGRTAGPLEALAGELAGAFAFPADVRDRTRVSALAAELESRFGHVDALVNCAGGQFRAPASELSPNGWRAVVETNLTGTFHCCSALRPLLERRGGAIVNVVANVWQRAAPGMAHSGAARAGVVSLTRTLAVEWAPRIRVNALSPGYVDTPALRQYGRNVLADAADAVPLGRAAAPEEIADAARFLLRAAYVTGEVLVVDGGLQLA